MANWANTARLGDSSTEEWKRKNLRRIEPIKGQSWEVYQPAAPAFEGLLNDLIKLGYHPTSSGGYNYRNIRGGDQLSQHAFGNAIDLNSMTNAQGQSATDIPHAAELAKKWGLEWGGNWKSNPDPMHFEWLGQAMQQAGYSPEQIKAAFLSTIASGESPGYDVMYGGAKFSDYSKHPHTAQTANNVTSDVAGRYQFKGSTWDEQAAKYGYKDFSPQTQDTAAWNYANDIFKTRTGGSLEEALASGDAGRINAAAQILNKTWTSLPGGAEQGKGFGASTFSDIYNKNLGAAPTEASPAAPAAPADTQVAKTTPETWKDKFRKSAGEAFKGLGDMAGSGAVTPTGITDTPKAALAANTPTLIGSADPQAADLQRQKLAQMMARLNSQKLWV